MAQHGTFIEHLTHVLSNTTYMMTRGNQSPPIFYFQILINEIGIIQFMVNKMLTRVA